MPGSGDRLGSWRLLWRLGEGSGGQVFRAEHDDGRRAAVKLAHPGTEARLAREVGLLGRLRHPALPALYEALSGPGTGAGPVGFAMELIEGRSLAALREDGTLLPEQIAGLLQQLCAVLAVLHAAGCVHRDLAGRNILVQPGGRLRLLDLGVASVADEETLAPDDRAVGEARRAPEGGPPTPAQDAWAAGALMWEVLTGRSAQGLAGPLDPDALAPPPLREVLVGLTQPDPDARLPLAAAQQRLAALEAPSWAFSQTGTVGPGTGAGAVLPDVPLPRQVGRYLLLEELGRGGMGSVWRAWDPSLRREVAIKLSPSGDPARLEREARAAAALDHPALCRVLDVGRHEGAPFLAMELVEGSTLAERLRGGPLAPPAAVQLVAQVAAGLGVAHRSGLVHRDVKPGNILLDAAGLPKLSDFGLARGPGDSELTRAGAVLGTPRYMAPEQARGLPADARSDVYALGVVLYECLSGRTPHSADDARALLARIAAEPGRPLRALVRVEPDLGRVVARATAFEAVDRYPDAAALGEDLARWLRGAPVLAAPPSALRRLRWWGHRNRLPLQAIGGTLGLLVVAALGLLLGSRWVAERAQQQRETLAEQRLALAARQVEQRRASAPQEAAALFRQIASMPEIQGTEALTRAWLAEAAQQTSDAERLEALGQAWLSAVASPALSREVLLAIAAVHRERQDWAQQAAVAALLEHHPAVGALPLSPQVQALLRDGALWSGHLSHPAVLADLDLAGVVGGWAVGQPLSDGQVPPGTPIAAAQLADLEPWRQRVIDSPLNPGHKGIATDQACGADMDGDGQQEILLNTGFWRGWDLRVLDSTGQRLIHRRRWGQTNLFGRLQTPLRELVLISSSRLWGSRLVFPDGDPYGHRPGISLLGLRQGRLEEAWEQPGVSCYRAWIADLDGDGLEDVLLACQENRPLVVLQRPGERFVPVLLGSLQLEAVVQADTDPPLELVVRLWTGARWLLGASTQPLPDAPRPLLLPEETDPELRAALELAGIGLQAQAIERLAAISSLEGHTPRGARAELLTARLLSGRPAEEHYLAAVEQDPATTAEGLRGAAAAALADGRLSDAQRHAATLQAQGEAPPPIPEVPAPAPVRISLQAPLEPGWQVGDPAGVRWLGSAGTQLQSASSQDLLRLPVRFVSPVLRVELDGTIERVEWGGGLGLLLLDQDEQPIAASRLRGTGGRQAVLTQLRCGDSVEMRGIALASAPDTPIAGPWWLSLSPAGIRCGMGPLDGYLEPTAGEPPVGGAGWLVLRGFDEGSAQAARLLLQGLTLWGMVPRLSEPTEEEALAAARWHLARLEPEAALHLAAAGTVERALALDALGRLPEARAEVARLWAQAPARLPALQRTGGALWSDWLRQHSGAAWPRLWLEAWGGAAWQHPTDPEVAAALREDLPELLEQLGELEIEDRLLVLSTRGRALRLQHALPAAEAHQEAAIQEAIRLLAAEPASGPSVHDHLIGITQERAALALLRGDRERALQVCQEALALDPLAGLLADSLAATPMLQPLWSDPRFGALLAAVPDWEGRPPEGL